VSPSTTRKQGSTPAPQRAGLCFRFMCWHPETGAHTLEMVLCFRCQHSVSWGCDVTKQPRKKTGPGRRKTDPDVELDPVSLPCQWCEAFGWEPVYEADEMERRRRDYEMLLTAERHMQPAAAPSFPAPSDEDGQASLF
jgi:hypothetical protein